MIIFLVSVFSLLPTIVFPFRSAKHVAPTAQQIALRRLGGLQRRCVLSIVQRSDLTTVWDFRLQICYPPPSVTIKYSKLSESLVAVVVELLVKQFAPGSTTNLPVSG